MTAPLSPLEPTTFFWQRVALDIVGPLPETYKGNRYILVMSEYTSRYMLAVAMKNQSARTVARKFIRHVILRYGSSLQILTDQGKNFLSNLMKDICSLLNIKQTRTTAYYPATDGMVERFNRTMGDMLASALANDKHIWDEYLPYIMYIYNSSVHASTNETPHYLLFGQDPIEPDDISSTTARKRYIDSEADEFFSIWRKAIIIAQEHFRKAQKTQKEFYDRGTNQKTFNIGDKELLLDTRLKSKLTPRWDGPYIVKRKMGPLNYAVQRETEKTTTTSVYAIVVHVNRMKLLPPRTDVPDIPSPTKDNHSPHSFPIDWNIDTIPDITLDLFPNQPDNFTIDDLFPQQPPTIEEESHKNYHTNDHDLSLNPSTNNMKTANKQISICYFSYRMNLFNLLLLSSFLFLEPKPSHGKEISTCDCNKPIFIGLLDTSEPHFCNKSSYNHITELLYEVVSKNEPPLRNIGYLCRQWLRQKTITGYFFGAYDTKKHHYWSQFKNDCTTCPIKSPFGILNSYSNSNITHYHKGHLTFIWNKPVAKPAHCVYTVVRQGFIINGKPETICKFDHSFKVKGIAETYIRYSRAPTTVINKTSNASIPSEFGYNLSSSFLVNDRTAMSMAQSSPMLAGIILGLPTCQRVQADGQTMLLQQCKKLTVNVKAQKTKCGWEPKFHHYTIGKDGFTRTKFRPCTWSNGLANQNGQPHEYFNGTWNPIKPNNKISSIGIKNHFDEEVDIEAKYLHNLETSFHSKEIEQMNMIGELMAVMRHDEINPISPILSQSQEKRSHSLLVGRWATANLDHYSLIIGELQFIQEVFRSLGLREPFPRASSAPAKPKISPSTRFVPYARQADQDLKLLNDKERAELEAVQRVKEKHVLAIIIAQRKEKEAVETALYLQQTCLLRRENEALIQRKEELAKSSSARRLAAKTPEPYVPSPIVRPAVLQIQPLPEVVPQTGPSKLAPEAVLVTPARSSKSSKSSKSRSSSKHSRKETPVGDSMEEGTTARTRHSSSASASTTSCETRDELTAERYTLLTELMGAALVVKTSRDKGERRVNTLKAQTRHERIKEITRNLAEISIAEERVNDREKLDVMLSEMVVLNQLAESQKRVPVPATTALVNRPELSLPMFNGEIAAWGSWKAAWSTYNEDASPSGDQIERGDNENSAGVLREAREIGDRPTKRNLFSLALKIFDPLGLIASVTLVGKLIMQKICLAGTGWYEPIPIEVVPQWKTFFDGITKLRNT
ncbi:Uncharacterized protein APZ42_013539 [Daphnia magna]|uniref:Integrase catalytic domain-containing protein n=1 Tax=Daphnia magna TaxID=35525 RepID=A0A162QS45_9CRUS|nr:Uncharacterized protein APZ42_013539 [Daphnia magna]